LYYALNSHHMKKFFIYFFGILFFIAIASGTGIFLASLRAKSIARSTTKSINNQAETTAISSVANDLANEGQIIKKEENSSISEAEKSQENNNSSNNQDKAAANLTFAVIGDTQYFKAGNSSGGLQRTVAKIKNQNPNLVFALGDLLGSCDGKNGCQSKLNEWKSALGTIFSKTYVTMGNHDRTGGSDADAAFQNFFSFPTNGPSGFSELTYSFDSGNSHFVVLDSEKPEEHLINKTQRDWLESDLGATKKENIFVFYHEPAYPVSSKIDESLDTESKDRNALWDIFVKYKVKAVFSGHEHIASRRKVAGIYQFGFGNTDSFDHDMPKAGVAEYAYRGKNYGLIEVNGSKVTVKTFSVDGKLLNSVTF
jgi:hypothetical protein